MSAAKSPGNAKFRACCELAKRFPGVEIGTSYRTPALKVKGKFMARLRTEAEGWLAIRCEFLVRDMLLEAAPEVFLEEDREGGLARRPRASLAHDGAEEADSRVRRANAVLERG